MNIENIYVGNICDGKTHAHQDCLVVIKHTDRQTAGTRRLIGYEKHCLLLLRACISLPLFCIVCTLQLYYCSEYLVILFYCSRSLSALQSEKYPLACTCHLFGCLFGLVLQASSHCVSGHSAVKVNERILITFGPYHFDCIVLRIEHIHLQEVGTG